MSTNIFDYIATMDALSLDSTGDGFGVLPLPTGTGTGTQGCVGIGTLPAMTGDGTADWAPFGVGVLPAMTGDGTADGYRPAWGAADLPALTASGAGHVLVESVGLLPPLFGVGYCGAVAEANIPTLTSYALSGYNTTASGDGTMPAMQAEAYVCGIDLPIDNSATSAAVVNLLQQGSTPLADAAGAICTGLATDDARALAVVRYVANNITYTSDSTSGIGDRWTCALATSQRHYGDCEDGAILAHALLLAAGVNPGRLRTAFGTVLSSSLETVGHAWLMYRRESDEEWIPLDWTQGASVYAFGLSNIRPQYDLSESYTKISYILTNEAFFAVNDANYIAKLAANRSTGAGTIAALTATGTTCISALGAGTLPAMTATGRCGARAAATLPKMTGDGTASTRIVGWGAGAIAVMTGDGQTGAMGSGTLPRLTSTGQCGFSAQGAFSLPRMTAEGTARVDSLAWGAAMLPRMTATGRVLGGQVAVGDGTISALRGTGRAAQGPLAHGDAMLPRLHGAGWASPLLVAVGVGELPPLIGRGHAVSAGTWATILQYDAKRWT